MRQWPPRTRGVSLSLRAVLPLILPRGTFKVQLNQALQLQVSSTLEGCVIRTSPKVILLTLPLTRLCPPF